MLLWINYSVGGVRRRLILAWACVLRRNGIWMLTPCPSPCFLKSPSGGTLVIGREQDCQGGCFDSSAGAIGSVSEVRGLRRD